MVSKFPSKQWSCSDLLHGAATVVDMASLPADAALKEQMNKFSAETEHLTMEQLEALLKDCGWILYIFLFLCPTFKITHTLQENDAQIGQHPLGGHVAEVARS